MMQKQFWCKSICVDLNIVDINSVDAITLDLVIVDPINGLTLDLNSVEPNGGCQLQALSTEPILAHKREETSMVIH